MFVPKVSKGYLFLICIGKTFSKGVIKIYVGYGAYCYDTTSPNCLLVEFMLCLFILPFKSKDFKWAFYENFDNFQTFWMKVLIFRPIQYLLGGIRRLDLHDSKHNTI